MGIAKEKAGKDARRIWTYLMNRIRREINQGSLNQKEIAQRCDLDPSNLSRMLDDLRGNEDPRLIPVLKIMNGLEISYIEFGISTGAECKFLAENRDLFTALANLPTIEKRRALKILESFISPL